MRTGLTIQRINDDEDRARTDSIGGFQKARVARRVKKLRSAGSNGGRDTLLLPLQQVKNLLVELRVPCCSHIETWERRKMNRRSCKISLRA